MSTISSKYDDFQKELEAVIKQNMRSVSVQPILIIFQRCLLKIEYDIIVLIKRMGSFWTAFIKSNLKVIVEEPDCQDSDKNL